jgi:hypothetical protein
MLKFNSEQYNTAVNFIKSGSVTNDIMIDLYLLYRRAEQVKKESADKRTPVPYYLIDAFAKYECDNRDVNNISPALENGEKINKIIRLYTAVTKAYSNEYKKKYDIEYNKMIKRSVEYDILDSLRDTLSSVIV